MCVGRSGCLSACLILFSIVFLPVCVYTPLRLFYTVSLFLFVKVCVYKLIDGHSAVHNISSKSCEQNSVQQETEQRKPWYHNCIPKRYISTLRHGFVAFFQSNKRWSLLEQKATNAPCIADLWARSGDMIIRRLKLSRSVNIQRGFARIFHPLSISHERRKFICTTN